MCIILRIFGIFAQYTTRYEFKKDSTFAKTNENNGYFRRKY